MSEPTEVTSDSPERHVLRLVRTPGADAVLTIDDIPQRITYLRVRPNETTITYEAVSDGIR